MHWTRNNLYMILFILYTEHCALSCVEPVLDTAHYILYILLVCYVHVNRFKQHTHLYICTYMHIYIYMYIHSHAIVHLFPARIAHYALYTIPYTLQLCTIHSIILLVTCYKPCVPFRNHGKHQAVCIMKYMLNVAYYTCTRELRYYIM